MRTIRELVMLLGLIGLAHTLPVAGQTETDGQGDPPYYLERPTLEREAVWRTFVQAMDAFEAGDLMPLAELFDVERLLDRALIGLTISEAGRHVFGRNLARQFVQTVSQSVGDEGSYRMVWVDYLETGELRGMARIFNGEAINYHEFSIEPDEHGRPRIVDVYIAMTGEMFSQTMRRSWLPAISEDQQQRITTDAAWARAYTEHFERIGQMATAHRINDYARVLEIYDTLPEVLQMDTVCRSLALMAASATDEARYGELLRKLVKVNGDDPSLVLHQLDFYVLKGQPERALECVDELDQFVGVDPFLDFYRGNLLFVLKRFDESAERFRAAANYAPDIIEPYWGLVTAELARRSWSGVVETLLAIEMNFNLEFNDLTTVEGYEEFVKTEAYRQWLYRHGEPESDDGG